MHKYNCCFVIQDGIELQLVALRFGQIGVIGSYNYRLWNSTAFLLRKCIAICGGSKLIEPLVFFTFSNYKINNKNEQNDHDVCNWYELLQLPQKQLPHCYENKKKEESNFPNVKRNRGKSQLSRTLVLITLTIYL